MSVDIDVQIDQKIIHEITEPSKYVVIMLNDDVTPIDWVIDVLIKIFKHSSQKAENISLTIHNEGSAIVGTYSYEIAEQKCIETTELARNSGFPLQIRLEKEG